MKDSARIHDEALVNNVSIRGNDTNRIIGIVEVSKYTGEVLFTKTIHKNDLLIGGCVYFLEKAYGKRASFSPASLDIELGVNTEILIDNDTLKNEQIIGLVCGTGGCNDSYNTVKPVQRHHRTVDGITPFRYVTQDLIGDERKEYFLRTAATDGTISYYGKLFKTNSEIKVLYSNELPVQNDVGDLITVDRIDVFAESVIYISGKDIREKFVARDGSSEKSRINTIGLVAGYPVLNTNGNTEYANVRTITTLNMENRELKNDEDTITIRYKQFII